MLQYGNRTIHINKKNLIDKIKENKKAHLEEFEKAKIAFKAEALEQLKKQTELIENGALEVKLNLINPVDNSKNYDKTIEMFNWEVDEVVELSQDEFKQYVQDDNDFSNRAKMSNIAYADKW